MRFVQVTLAGNPGERWINLDNVLGIEIKPVEYRDPLTRTKWDVIATMSNAYETQLGEFDTKPEAVQFVREIVMAREIPKPGQEWRKSLR